MTPGRSAARALERGVGERQDPDGCSPGCCAPVGRIPSRGGAGTSLPLRDVRVRGVRHRVEQVLVPGQTFNLGDARGDGRWADGETPVHPVRLDAFHIDATSVTNEDFARFVAATGHRTEAEVFGCSAVFHDAVTAARDDVLGHAPQAPWWWSVRGADWRHPGGAGSGIAELGDHPVVHVSWNDAVAYCAWADRRLPTEAQWEAASRGGLDGARYPWGDDLDVGDDGAGWRVNIFQGSFPVRNLAEDGYRATAPVRTYQPNAYGLWQTVGNVWEWCADIWARDTYVHDEARGVAHEPAGPAATSTGAPRAMRGGSHLCHDSYCNRYRNAARSSNTPDSSMSNVGFRTAARPPAGATRR